MEISDIKVRRIYTEGRLRALVSITVDGELAVHDIKVIEGPERTFVAMPSRREENGVFRDVVHPIKPETRRMMEDKILAEYERFLKEREEEEAHAAAALEGAPEADDGGEHPPD